MTPTRLVRFGWRRATLALPVLLALGMNAQAQEKTKTAVPEDAALQEIVVTGSRIARPEFDRLDPTTTIDSKELDRRGYIDIGQALNQLPQFAVSPSSAANAQTGFGVAQSFVDMYGLGSQRTLTLVNGRRFVSGNTSSTSNSASNSSVGGPGTQVDMNVIPTKLIDHVEVISVGGAPVYGADAISGAVNIILKKDFQGVDVDAQVGATQEPDAWNYRGRVLAGQNLFDNRMNVMLVAEFTKSDGLSGSSRKEISDDYLFEPPATAPPAGQCCASVLTRDSTVPSMPNGGLPLVDDIFLGPAYGLTGGLVGVTNPAGQTLAFGSGGALQPYNIGTATGNGIFNSGGDGFRFSQSANLLSPTERINIDTVDHFQVNDHLDVFAEGWFSETHAHNLGTQPAYDSNLFGPAGTAGGNFVVNINNPFISAGDRALICAQQLRCHAAVRSAPVPGHGAGRRGAVSRVEYQPVLCRAIQYRSAERRGRRHPDRASRRARCEGRFRRGRTEVSLGKLLQLWHLGQHPGDAGVRVPESRQCPERHHRCQRQHRLRGQAGERGHFHRVERVRAAQYIRHRLTEHGRPTIHHPSSDRRVVQYPA
jgi:iron complex outermembrane recepter protein